MREGFLGHALSTPYTKLVSVVVPAYNAADSIAACIASLLNQTYGNIEIIVSDDCSSDDTLSIISRFDDGRLVVIVSDRNRGPSAARNRGIFTAKGDIIFFTDDDTTVPNYWIECGLLHFVDHSVVGVEGRVIYVCDGYKPSYSDRIVQNTRASQYMTANVAYRKSLLLEAGGFDERFFSFEDRELGFRMRLRGRIAFSDAPVYHKREQYTLKSYLFEARKVKWWVILLKQYNDRSRCFGFVYEPLNLLAIAFPPLILGVFARSRMRTRRDWLFVSLLYFRLVCERLTLWRNAIRERVFVV
jgi:glycosyltransferase involved in cell wall biosynthesis